jgi:rhamnose transport system substrate-binding protein
MKHPEEEAHLSSHRLRPLAALSFSAAIVFAACGGGATPSPSASAVAPSSAASPAASTGASGSPAGSAAANGDLNVVFIPKAINNPYFDAAATGAQKAATELGGQFKQIGSQNATAAEQIPFIQDATTQGYKAIVVSATGADEVAPALKAAKDAGIKVVGYDSSPAEGAYDVFVNQTDFSLIGGAMAQWACDLAPDCSGDIAILSATATATNQNAWIADFNKALTTDPKFAKLKLVDTVYGDDDATKSTNEANGLLQKYPNLKVIVAPTTVGILAAAQVVKQAASAVKVTGLGLPNDMKAFVADGTVPEFGLWSVPDLGYLAYYVAAKLITGEIKGTPGETFTVPNLNDGKPYTIGDKSVVILGPPFVFNKDNVNNFDF